MLRLYVRFALRRQFVLVLRETLKDPALSPLYLAAVPDSIVRAWALLFHFGQFCPAAGGQIVLMPFQARNDAALPRLDILAVVRHIVRAGPAVRKRLRDGPESGDDRSGNKDNERDASNVSPLHDGSPFLGEIAVVRESQTHGVAYAMHRGHASSGN